MPLFFFTFLSCSTDSEHFGCDRPSFALLEELREDITRHEEMWSLYEEYSTQLGEMSSQDWITFR